MAQYCPVCFNSSLKLASAGIVYVKMNGKRMDTSRFYFDLKQDTQMDIEEKFVKVVEDFMKWYNTFNFKPVIDELEVWSPDFKCTSGCNLKGQSNYSVIGILFQPKEIVSLIEDAGKRHNIKADLSTKSFN